MLGIFVRLNGKEWNLFLLDNEFMEGGCSGGDVWLKFGDIFVSDFVGFLVIIKNYF